MSDALGSGWLITLIVAIPTFLTVTASVLVPFGKWVAGRWQRNVAEPLVEDKEMLVAALNDASRALSRCEIERDALISEVRLWRAGRTPDESERFAPRRSP